MKGFKDPTKAFGAAMVICLFGRLWGDPVSPIQAIMLYFLIYISIKVEGGH